MGGLGQPQPDLAGEPAEAAPGVPQSVPQSALADPLAASPSPATSGLPLDDAVPPQVAAAQPPATQALDTQQDPAAQQQPGTPLTPTTDSGTTGQPDSQTDTPDTQDQQQSGSQSQPDSSGDSSPGTTTTTTTTTTSGGPGTTTTTTTTTTTDGGGGGDGTTGGGDNNPISLYGPADPGIPPARVEIDTDKFAEGMAEMEGLILHVQNIWGRLQSAMDEYQWAAGPAGDTIGDPFRASFNPSAMGVLNGAKALAEAVPSVSQGVQTMFNGYNSTEEQNASEAHSLINPDSSPPTSTTPPPDDPASGEHGGK